MRLPKHQRALAWICHTLAGDRHEERATNLLPDSERIKGLRLSIYQLFARLRFVNGMRIARKYNTHMFEV